MAVVANRAAGFSRGSFIVGWRQGLAIAWLALIGLTGFLAPLLPLPYAPAMPD